jgi:ubiquinone/menaquinone biosynthesis C-methylase UbiE
MGIEKGEEGSSAGDAKYIPAARWRIFNRVYDPVIALTMRERRWRGPMADRASSDLPEGGVAVDVGCGTGTFAIALAGARPDARVIGVDGDPEILALAARKTGAAAVDWRQGRARELPLADAGVDVLSASLMLHHLLWEEKQAMLAEAARVLKPGGHLHVADWGPPQDPAMSAAFFVLQAIDGFDRTRDHRAGRLPELFAGAGFEPVERYERLRTGFGGFDLWRAANATGSAFHSR